MSTVTLTIGPKNYTIACAQGEEAHISALGAIIAEKYAQLGTARAPLEAQNLLFAALFLADELAETKNRDTPNPAPATDQQAIEALRAAIAQLEDDLAAAREGASATDADLSGGSAASDTLAQQLEALAARAEATASALEAEALSA